MGGVWDETWPASPAPALGAAGGQGTSGRGRGSGPLPGEVGRESQGQGASTQGATCATRHVRGKEYLLNSERSTWVTIARLIKGLQYYV